MSQIWKRKAKRAANKAAMITTGKTAVRAVKAVAKSSLKKTGGVANKGGGSTIPPAAPVSAVRHGGVSAASRTVQPKVQSEQIVNITPQFKVSLFPCVIPAVDEYVFVITSSEVVRM